MYSYTRLHFHKLILYPVHPFLAYKYATCHFLELLSPIFGYDQTAAIFACDDDDVTVPGLLNIDPAARTSQYERNLQRHHKYRNSECAWCEPLEMSLSIFQRKLNRCHSIIQKVLCRSTTGLGLGLDAHRHLGLVILLFWNTYSTTGCYRNYIARDYGDSVVSTQLYRGFQSGGPHGAYKCCFTFVSSCRNECGKPCMFMDDPEWESHSLSGVEFRICDFRGFTCLCPDVSSSAITGMIFVTSYCLKSSNMTVSRRAFGNSGEYLKEQVLQWIRSMRMHEC